MSHNLDQDKHSLLGETISREEKREHDGIIAPIDGYRTSSKKGSSKGDADADKEPRTTAYSITPSKLKSNSVLFSILSQKQRSLSYSNKRRNVFANSSSMGAFSDRNGSKGQKPRELPKGSSSVPCTPLKSKKMTSLLKHDRRSVSPSYSSQPSSRSSSPKNNLPRSSSPLKTFTHLSNQSNHQECAKKKIDSKTTEQGRTRQLDILKRIYINKSAASSEDRTQEVIQREPSNQKIIGEVTSKKEGSMGTAISSIDGTLSESLVGPRKMPPFQKNFKPIERSKNRIGSDANSETSLNELDMNLLLKARESSLLKKSSTGSNIAPKKPKKATKVAKILNERSDLKSLLSSRLKNGNDTVKEAKPQGFVNDQSKRKADQKSTNSVSDTQNSSSTLSQKDFIMRVPSIHDILKKSELPEIRPTSTEKKVPITQFLKHLEDNKSDSTYKEKTAQRGLSSSDCPADAYSSKDQADTLLIFGKQRESNKEGDVSIELPATTKPYTIKSPLPENISCRFTKKQDPNKRLVKKVTSRTKINIAEKPNNKGVGIASYDVNFEAEPLSSINYASETSSLKNSRKNSNKHGSTLVELSDDLMGASSDEARFQNNSNTHRMEVLKNARTITSTIEGWKHFDKVQFKTLMNSLLITHQPFNSVMPVSCTNDICSINNYEETKVHELQRLPNRLVYIDLRKEEEWTRKNKLSFAQKVIKPRRKEKFRIPLQKRKHISNTVDEKRVQPQEETCQANESEIVATRPEKISLESFYTDTSNRTNPEKEIISTNDAINADMMCKENEQRVHGSPHPSPCSILQQGENQTASMDTREASGVTLLESTGIDQLKDLPDNSLLNNFFVKIMNMMKKSVVSEKNNDLLNADSVIENLAGEIMKYELQIATLTGKNVAYQKKISKMETIQNKLLNDLANSISDNPDLEKHRAIGNDNFVNNPEPELFQRLFDRVEQDLFTLDSMERNVARSLEDIKNIKNREVKDHPIVKSLEETILKNKHYYESQLKAERLRVHNLKAALLTSSTNSIVQKEKNEEILVEDLNEAKKALKNAMTSVIAKQRFCERLLERCNEYEQTIKAGEKKLQIVNEELMKEKKMQELLKNENARSIVKINELHRSHKRLQSKVIDLERIKRDLSSINSLKKHVNELNISNKKKNCEISDLKKEIQTLQRVAISSKSNNANTSSYSSALEALQTIQKSMEKTEKQLINIRCKLPRREEQSNPDVRSNELIYGGSVSAEVANTLVEIDLGIVSFHNELVNFNERLSQLTQSNSVNVDKESNNIKPMPKFKEPETIVESDEFSKEKQNMFETEITRVKEINISLSSKFREVQLENSTLKRKVKSLQEQNKKDMMLDKMEKQTNENCKKKFQVSNDQLQATILRLVKEKQSLLARITNLERENNRNNGV